MSRIETHHNGFEPASLSGPEGISPADSPEVKKNFHLYRAQYHLHRKEHQQSAYHFIQAGDLARAGQIYETIYDYKNAIRAYVRAGQVQTAGNLLIRLGDKRRAARLFEKAKKYDLAIRFYKETDSLDELLSLHEKLGNYFEAFKVAYKKKDLTKAQDYATRILKSDPNYVDAHIYLMVERLEAGDHDKILEYYYDIFSDTALRFTSKTLTSFAEILESAGHFKQSLDVYYMLINQMTEDASIRAKIKNLERRFLQASELPNLKKYENRFQLYQKLGTGAMGVVYKARDTVTDQWVAVKTLPLNHNDEDLLSAFLQEGRTAKRLSHPNITQVFDFGIDNKHYFIAMEYLDGKSLKEVLAKTGPVSLENFISIASPLAKALLYAHQNHIIHRDIKPSNIMLLSNRTVKLMDFGISKIIQTTAHKSIARGTPIYMSPEQILGIQTTRQSDLYSLGVVFYEMLTGKPPFFTGDVLHHHIHTPPVPISTINRNIPFPLVNLIMSCLAKKADRRPASVHKTLEVLENISR